MPNLSVSQFNDQLQSEIDDICTENGWKSTNAKRKGTAFAIWCARLISEQDARYDTDPIDAHLDGPGDLGVDLVFSSSDTDDVLVCQCKFVGAKRTIEEKDLTDFLSLHDRLSIKGHVSEFGHDDLRDALPISTMKKFPSRVIYRLITNGTVSRRSRKVWNAREESNNIPSYELWTRDEIKRAVAEVDSSEDESIGEVTLELPAGQYIHFIEPRNTLVAVVGTNAIKNLWNKHHHALYAENIRGGLRSKLNHEMQLTLESQPEDFFYYNNGLSATCSAFRIDKHGPHSVLHAEDFQIINGAQTLNAIGERGDPSDGRVLLKLTAVARLEREFDFSENIIRYNNTQNIVKRSDFRSNDTIQKWLEAELGQSNWRWPAIPRRRYIRKRSRHQPRGLGKQLKLEEFAKIRYAWLYEPMPVIDETGSLFQDQSSDGRYRKAFGIDGELSDKWARRDLGDAMLAVAFHDAILDKLDEFVARRKEHNEKQKEKGKADDLARYEWMRLYRWHFLSLAGIWVRHESLQASELLRSADQFSDRFSEFMSTAFKTISAAEQIREQGERSSGSSLTMRNWRQQAGMWDALKRDFANAMQDAEDLRELGGNRV